MSAVTPDGITFFNKTVEAMCEKVYVIEDENAACSSELLSLLRGYALSGGQDIIASPCPLDPSG